MSIRISFHPCCGIDTTQDLIILPTDTSTFPSRPIRTDINQNRILSNAKQLRAVVLCQCLITMTRLKRIKVGNTTHNTTTAYRRKLIIKMAVAWKYAVCKMFDLYHMPLDSTRYLHINQECLKFHTRPTFITSLKRINKIKMIIKMLSVSRVHPAPPSSN